MKWYKKSAEQGVSDAQYNLGDMYKNGQGVPRNYREAIKWFIKAAEQDNVEAQNSLGEIYADGKIVPQSYQEAAKWYIRAAEQGNAHAQYTIGYYYQYGIGVSKDRISALVWYSLCASTKYKVALIAAKERDFLISVMTKDEIAKAQELAQQYIKIIQQKTKN